MGRSFRGWRIYLAWRLRLAAVVILHAVFPRFHRWERYEPPDCGCCGFPAGMGLPRLPRLGAAEGVPAGGVPAAVRTTPAQVREALATIEAMRKADALPEASYYKCVVTLASEWFCRHDDYDEALLLLNRCPPSYYGQHLLPQMQEDALFAEVVLELSDKMVRYGIVDAGILRPTMPAAEA